MKHLYSFPLIGYQFNQFNLKLNISRRKTEIMHFYYPNFLGVSIF